MNDERRVDLVAKALAVLGRQLDTLERALAVIAPGGGCGDVLPRDIDALRATLTHRIDAFAAQAGHDDTACN